MKKNSIYNNFIVWLVVVFVFIPRFALAAVVTCGNQDAGAVADSCKFGDLISAGVGITQYLLEAAAVIAVGGIVFAGYAFIVSAGEATKRSEAKKVLVNTIVGFIIILLAVLLVSSLKSVLGYTDKPLLTWSTEARQPPPATVENFDINVVVSSSSPSVLQGPTIANEVLPTQPSVPSTVVAQPPVGGPIGPTSYNVVQDPPVADSSRLGHVYKTLSFDCYGKWMTETFDLTALKKRFGR